MIGSLSNLAGSRVSPGHDGSSGVLNTSTVAFATSSTFRAELGGINPGTGYDQLNVAGTISLSDATLDLGLLSGFLPQTGTEFRLMDNDGVDPVNGIFNGLPQGSSFFLGGEEMRISYSGGTGNDVVVSAVPEPMTWVLIGLTGLCSAAVGWQYRKHRLKALNAEFE